MNLILLTCNRLLFRYH